MVEVQEALGRVSYRRVRSTGTHVGVYRTYEAELSGRSDLPWTTLCEEHGGIATHPTRKLAEEWAPYPREWCPTCQEGEV